jgi:hypothetical protein
MRQNANDHDVAGPRCSARRRSRASFLTAFSLGKQRAASSLKRPSSSNPHKTKRHSSDVGDFYQQKRQGVVGGGTGQGSRPSPRSSTRSTSANSAHLLRARISPKPAKRLWHRGAGVQGRPLRPPRTPPKSGRHLASFYRPQIPRSQDLDSAIHKLRNSPPRKDPAPWPGASTTGPACSLDVEARSGAGGQNCSGSTLASSTPRSEDGPRHLKRISAWRVSRSNSATLQAAAQREAGGRASSWRTTTSPHWNSDLEVLERKSMSFNGTR